MSISGVREMFVDDAVAFGSKVEMVTTREALETEQWRPVWPTMENYHYDLSMLEVIVSPDRLMVVGWRGATAALPHFVGKPRAK
jgi:hypothetical protein